MTFKWLFLRGLKLETASWINLGELHGPTWHREAGWTPTYEPHCACPQCAKRDLDDIPEEGYNCMTFCTCAHLPTYLPIHPCIYLFVCLSFYLSIWLSVCIGPLPFLLPQGAHIVFFHGVCLFLNIFFVRQVVATLCFMCLAKLENVLSTFQLQEEVKGYWMDLSAKLVRLAEWGDSWRETTCQRLFWIVCLGTLARAPNFLMIEA